MDHLKKSSSILPLTVYSTASFVLLLGANLSAFKDERTKDERARVVSILDISFIKSLEVRIKKVG